MKGLREIPELIVQLTCIGILIVAVIHHNIYAMVASMFVCWNTK